MKITDHPDYALYMYAWIVAIAYNPLLADARYITRQLNPDRTVAHRYLIETCPVPGMVESFSRN